MELGRVLDRMVGAGASAAVHGSDVVGLFGSDERRPVARVLIGGRHRGSHRLHRFRVGIAILQRAIAEQMVGQQVRRRQRNIFQCESKVWSALRHGRFSALGEFPCFSSGRHEDHGSVARAQILVYVPWHGAPLELANECVAVGGYRATRRALRTLRRCHKWRFCCDYISRQDFEAGGGRCHRLQEVASVHIHPRSTHSKENDSQTTAVAGAESEPEAPDPL